MLDSAKNAQEFQTNLLEEAQNLVAFLKQSANPGCISSSSPYNNMLQHQHFNGHFAPQVSTCCPASPVPPFCVHPQSNSPIQLSLRRRGKTPERSKAGAEADMDTLVTTIQQNGCYDPIKTRNSKSVMSNSSSCSGGSNGSNTSNKRASMIDPLGERKLAGTRSPIINNGKGGECNKVSHL